MRYLIWAYDYSWRSGGIIALHRLGQLLAQYAPVFLISNKTTEGSHAQCVTMQNAQTLAVMPDTVVIYPDVVPANPLEAKWVVRWVMYYVGKHEIGDKEYASNELVIAYQPQFVANTKHDGAPVVTIVDSQRDLFTDMGKKRNKTGVLMRKAAKQGQVNLHYLEHNRQYINNPIWLLDKRLEQRTSFKEWNYDLNKCDLFITFDVTTYHAVMAAMAGCRVVVVPSEKYTSEQFHAQALMRNGIAYGFEELDYAQQTKHLLTSDVETLEQNNRMQAEQFHNIVTKHYL